MKYLWFVMFVGTVWAANWSLQRWGIVDAPLYSVPAGVFFVAGYDSVDGTFLAFGPDILLPRLFGWMAALDVQPILGAGAS